MKSVYIEPSIVSYFAARPSRDLIFAAHQQITHDWWQNRDHYELIVSELVIIEASRGNATASALRMAILGGMKRLALSEQVGFVAGQLVAAKLVPAKAIADALHIAAAATGGIDFLLTWNCAHIANATIRPKIESWFRSQGITAPTICTPEELIGSDSRWRESLVHD